MKIVKLALAVKLVAIVELVIIGKPVNDSKASYDS